MNTISPETRRNEEEKKLLIKFSKIYLQRYCKFCRILAKCTVSFLDEKKESKHWFQNFWKKVAKSSFEKYFSMKEKEFYFYF
jgi:hypothetical protein